jgi:hypothetical protein
MIFSQLADRGGKLHAGFTGNKTARGQRSGHRQGLQRSMRIYACRRGAGAATGAKYSSRQSPWKATPPHRELDRG